MLPCLSWLGFLGASRYAANSLKWLNHSIYLLYASLLVVSWFLVARLGFHFCCQIDKVTKWLDVACACFLACRVLVCPGASLLQLCCQIAKVATLFDLSLVCILVWCVLVWLGASRLYFCCQIPGIFSNTERREFPVVLC